MLDTKHRVAVVVSHDSHIFIYSHTCPISKYFPRLQVDLQSVYDNIDNVFDSTTWILSLSERIRVIEYKTLSIESKTLSNGRPTNTW